MFLRPCALSCGIRLNGESREEVRCFRYPFSLSKMSWFSVDLLVRNLYFVRFGSNAFQSGKRVRRLIHEATPNQSKFCSAELSPLCAGRNRND